MDNIRLKTKIGDHEFEAEGAPEYVREQFQSWQELVKLAVAAPVRRNEDMFEFGEQQAATPVPSASANDTALELDKIMRVDSRYVSLTARMGSVHDAVLVMLYGQKTIRSNDAVTGAELLSGLEATGGFAVSRLDRILEKLANDGDIMAFGERRGKRYRLTNTGAAKAKQLAADLIAAVA